MIRKPIFSFDGITSTGINEVPVYGLVSIENYDGLGTPKYVTLLDKTNLDANTTIEDFLLDMSAWTDFGAPEIIDLSQYARKDIAETMTGVTSEALASSGYIDLLDYDDAIGFDTGIRSYVRDGIWNLGKMGAEVNDIGIQIEGNIVYHAGNINTATGLNASTLNSLTDTDFVKIDDAISTPSLHITSSLPDVTPTTDGPFNIGTLASTHLSMDDNEIMAKSGSTISTLHLNREGGNVHVNSGLGSGDLYVKNQKVIADAGTLFDRNGYIKLSNGLIFQWGERSVANNSYVDHALPIAFPNSFLNVVASTRTYRTHGEGTDGATMIDNATVRILNGNDGTMTISYFAIGY